MIVLQQQIFGADERSLTSDLTMIQSGAALTSKIKKAARLVLLSLYIMTEGKQYVGQKTLGAVARPL
jgi:hypothetical protein